MNQCNPVPTGSAWVCDACGFTRPHPFRRNCSEKTPIAVPSEQERRLKICNWCEKLNECLPTPCAKKKAIESGSCPDNKWMDIDYTRPVPDSTDYPLFLSEYPAYERLSRAMKVTGLPPNPHKTRLYALIATWHDADIVAAAVKNCYAEGCDRVYVIDNDSPDGTAKAAVAAGAILAESYTTAYFQDVLRVRKMNAIIRDITESEKHDELWWMALDCDEMPRGPGRLTIRQFLEQLPEDCNTVGANAFDHYPTKPLANVPGEHPAKYQPMGWFRNWPTGGFCQQLHWKHPLNRYRNGKFTAIWLRGLHDSRTTEEHGPPIEPKESLLLHHFMFRNEADTRARHIALCAPNPALGGLHRSSPDDDAIASEGAMTRFRNLDLIYQGKWKEARMPHLQARRDLQKGGIPLVHWSKLFHDYEYEPRIQ